MPKIIVLAAVGLLLYLLWQWFTRLPADQKKRQLRNILVWAAVGITLLLVATGRLHWIGAALTAAFAAGRVLLPVLIKLLPFMATLKQRQAPPQTPPKTTMTVAEAYAILGLEVGASKPDVIDAHRRLMAKLHPDKGGNDFLAAQLNSAKDTILNS